MLVLGTTKGHCRVPIFEELNVFDDNGGKELDGMNAYVVGAVNIITGPNEIDENDRSLLYIGNI